MIRKIGKPIVYTLTLITNLIFLGIIVYILIMGIPNLSPKLFERTYSTENQSLVSSVITTLFTIVLSFILTLPVGIFTAIYVAQYAKSKRFVTIIRFATETLAAIPSIVYGLFGMLLFVSSLKMGYSLLSGVFTISIMILPTIIRTSENAINSVNTLQRDASLALGATKSSTIFKVILPEALPGILSGVFLSTGRIIGESAALIYTMGTVAQIPKNLLASSRTLAVHMYQLSTEGLYVKESYATAVVLLVFVILVNLISEKLGNMLVEK